MLSKTLIHLVIAAASASLFKTSSAQSTTTTATTAAASAVAPAAANGYTYIGCYNETTGISGTGGARALANGKMEADEAMTIDLCTSYCQSSNLQYAGLEYSDECWCAPYLSSLSTQLDASACDLACKGNDSEICGGSLTISLYNLTSKKSGSSSSGSGGGGSGAATVALSWSLGVGALVLALGGGLLR